MQRVPDLLSKILYGKSQSSSLHSQELILSDVFYSDIYFEKQVIPSLKDL